MKNLFCMSLDGMKYNMYVCRGNNRLSRDLYLQLFEGCLRKNLFFSATITLKQLWSFQNGFLCLDSVWTD
jgi:hypothetical protein